MYRSTVNRRLKDERAFTVVEIVLACVIALFIFSGSWSVYRMVRQWWQETVPLIEAQRIARVTLLSVIDGQRDSTAGADGSYARRNGIAWTVYEPVISAVLSTADRIEFGLEREKEVFADYPTPHNVRAFYLTLDATTGLRIVSYMDNASIVHQIRSTLGITDLKFEKFKDFVTNKIYIKVTATVERDIPGTRQGTPYHIKVGYADYIFLRNF